MKSKFNIEVKGFLPLFFLLVFSACQKESTEIGADLRQDKGGINSIDVVYSDIDCRTSPGDTFNTLNAEINQLGVINDPVFGLRKASVIIQPRLSEFGTDFNSAVADSAYLILRYDNTQTISGRNYDLYYGDTTSTVVLDVYQLGEDLDQSTYGSNYTPTLGNKIGEYTGSFNINTSTEEIIGNDTVSILPELKIKLDQAFAQQLIDYPSSVYESQDNFVNELKGIVVVPRNDLVSGDGAIISIEAKVDATGLLLYYSDSLRKAYPTSLESRSVNFFENDLSSVIVNQLNSTDGFDKVYPQALAGGKVRVEVPELNQLIEAGEDVVINEASLSIPLDEDALIEDVYDAPISLFLLIPDSTNPERALTEVTEQNDPRFAVGDLSGNEYTIYFNRYLQYLIREYNETGINYFDGFYLTIPRATPAVPYRVVLNTDKTAEDVKVSVTYTKLN